METPGSKCLNFLSQTWRWWVLYYIDDEIKPVALNLKAVQGGQVDIIVLIRDDHVPAEGHILTHNLK